MVVVVAVGAGRIFERATQHMPGVNESIVSLFFPLTMAEK